MKRIVLTLIYSLIVLHVAFSQSMVDSRSLISEGIQLFDQGKFEAAKLRYEKVLGADKDNQYALFELAYTYEATKNYDQAIAISKKAVKRKDLKDEVLSNFYVLYGNALDKNGQLKKALKCYQKGIAQFPDFHLLHFNAGVSFLKDEQFTKAQRHFQEAVRTKPSHASSHYYLAMTSEKLDQRIPAILASAAFLSLDTESQRAKTIRDLLPKLLIKEAQKTAEGISISVNMDPLTTEKQDNDFLGVELILDISNAKEMQDNQSIEIDSPSFLKSFALLCDLLASHHEQNGFFWKYYAPYFYQLAEKNYTDIFVKLISDPKTEKSKQWKSLNYEQIREFGLWSEDYKWNEE